MPFVLTILPYVGLSNLRHLLSIAAVLVFQALISGATMTLDQSFSPTVAATPRDFLSTVVLDDRGRILIGGGFTGVGGVPRTALARLTSSGKLDLSFDASISSDLGSPFINAIIPCPDGTLLIGGCFDHVNGAPNLNLARLTTSGAVDAGFRLSNPDNDIRCLALQADGKILVSGAFSRIAGTTRKYFCRLYPDGRLDNTFERQEIEVYSIIVQPDGKILATGAFSYGLGSSSPQNIVRLNTDGTIDQTFVVRTDHPVQCATVLRDRSLLIGGNFQTVNGQAKKFLARVFQNGELDSSFSGPGLTSSVFTIATLDDGSFLIGGWFRSLNGKGPSYLAHLNSDGTLDKEFDASIKADVSSPMVYCITREPDGGVLLGGRFQEILGDSRVYLARLKPVPFMVGVPVLSSHWAPEFYRITFEPLAGCKAYWVQHSDNLIQWTPVAMLPASTSAISYLDPTSSGEPHGFYRVVGEK